MGILVIDSYESGSSRGPPAWCLFEPMEWDWLVQKPRKVLFFGKELKGVKLCSERTVFQFSLKGRGWGCFIEFSVGRGGVLAGFLCCWSVPGAAPLHTAPAAAISDVVLPELLPTACGASVLISSISHEKRWTGRNTSWNQDCREKYQ